MTATLCAPLALLPTPLVETPRLADALELAGPLLVKRDDLTGFAVAGNKARPLEALLAEAPGRQADVLVTGGAPGSNFVQAATAAARVGRAALRAGPAPGRRIRTRCTRTWPPRSAWGAEVRWTGDADRASSTTRAARGRRRAGRAPGGAPTGPRGGATHRWAPRVPRAVTSCSTSSPLGRTADRWSWSAAGSGGTLAGLVAGNVARDRPLRVVGRLGEPATRRGRRARARPGPAGGRSCGASRRRRPPTSSWSMPAAPGTACPRRRATAAAVTACAPPGWCSTRCTRRRRWPPCRRSRRPGRRVLAHRGLLDAVAGWLGGRELRRTSGALDTMTAGAAGPARRVRPPELIESGFDAGERRRAAAAQPVSTSPTSRTCSTCTTAA